MADGREISVWDNHAEQCKNQNRKLFDFSQLKDSFLVRKIDELKCKGVKKVLDLGCGPGYWRNLFLGLEYVGFDQSSKMIQLAKEVDSFGTFVLGSEGARNLNKYFKSDEKFDLIFTSAVLQHNRHEPDKREIVQQMYNLLIPNGYYLCTENTFRNDNCPESYNNPNYSDGNSFTSIGWEKFMKPLGFKMVEYCYKSDYLYTKI